MRESGGKRKEVGTAERFPPKKPLLIERLLLYCLSGAFIAKPPLQNTKKSQKQKLLQGTNWEETKKCNKKVKTSKNRKSEQCMR